MFKKLIHTYLNMTHQQMKIKIEKLVIRNAFHLASVGIGIISKSDCNQVRSGARSLVPGIQQLIHAHLTYKKVRAAAPPPPNASYSTTRYKYKSTSN